MRIQFIAGYGPITRSGAEELAAGGHEILVGAHEEPWGQWSARLQSPEGVLVGRSYLRDLHPEAPRR